MPISKIPKQNKSETTPPYKINNKLSRSNSFSALILIVLIILVSIGILHFYNLQKINNKSEANATKHDSVNQQIALSETSNLNSKIVTPASQECNDFFNTPEGAHIYAVGNLRGQIHDSAPDHMNIIIKDTSAPLILILGAKHSATWTLNLEPDQGEVDILGIILTGEGKQNILALPSEIPILSSTFEDRTDCGHADFRPENVGPLYRLSMQTTGEQVKQVFYTENGFAIIPMNTTLPDDKKLAPSVAGLTTQETTQSSSNAPQSHPSKAQGVELSAGKLGVQEAIRAGLMRPATAHDFQQWQTSYQRYSNGHQQAKIMPHFQTMVVLKEMTLPKDLTGAHSLALILPKGVPYPSGELGHSIILDISNGTCMGVLCPSISN